MWILLWALAFAASPAPAELDLRFVQLIEASPVSVPKLAKVTSEIVAVRLKRSEDLASQGRWVEALDELAAARKRIARAADKGAVVDGTAVDALEEQTTRRGIAVHMDAAQEALAGGRPGEAIARLDAAVDLGGPDELTLRAQGMAALGDRHLDAGRLFDAADAWAEAVRIGGDPGVRERAERLDRAIGRWALDRGACRLASEHLARVPDAERAAEARACAITAVQLEVVAPEDKASRQRVARVDRAARDRLAEARSTYLQLGGAGQRTVPGPDGPIRRGPVRIEAELRAPVLTHGQPQRVVRHGPANRAGAAVTITWEELNEPVSARVDAAIRERDGATGETASGLRVIGQAEVAARWAGAVLGYEALGVYGREVGTVQWGPAGDPVARRNAAEARELARTAATEAAATALGIALADRILTEIDTEAVLPPPTLADLGL